MRPSVIRIGIEPYDPEAGAEHPDHAFVLCILDNGWCMERWATITTTPEDALRRAVRLWRSGRRERLQQAASLFVPA